MNDYLAQILTAAFPQGMRNRTPEQLHNDMGGLGSRLQQLSFMRGVPQSTWQNLDTQASGMLGQPAPQMPQQAPQQSLQPPAPATPSPAAAGMTNMQNRMQQFGQSPFGMRRGLGGLGSLGQSYRPQGIMPRPLTVSDWR